MAARRPTAPAYEDVVHPDEVYDEPVADPWDLAGTAPEGPLHVCLACGASPPLGSGCDHRTTATLERPPAELVLASQRLAAAARAFRECERALKRLVAREHDAGRAEVVSSPPPASRLGAPPRLDVAPAVPPPPCVRCGFPDAPAPAGRAGRRSTGRTAGQTLFAFVEPSAAAPSSTEQAPTPVLEPSAAEAPPADDSPLPLAGASPVATPAEHSPSLAPTEHSPAPPPTGHSPAPAPAPGESSSPDQASESSPAPAERPLRRSVGDDRPRSVPSENSPEFVAGQSDTLPFPEQALGAPAVRAGEPPATRASEPPLAEAGAGEERVAPDEAARPTPIELMSDAWIDEQLFGRSLAKEVHASPSPSRPLAANRTPAATSAANARKAPAPPADVPAGPTASADDPSADVPAASTTPAFAPSADPPAAPAVTPVDFGVVTDAHEAPPPARPRRRLPATTPPKNASEDAPATLPARGRRRARTPRERGGET